MFPNTRYFLTSVTGIVGVDEIVFPKDCSPLPLEFSPSPSLTECKFLLEEDDLPDHLLKWLNVEVKGVFLHSMIESLPNCYREAIFLCQTIHFCMVTYKVKQKAPRFQKPYVANPFLSSSQRVVEFYAFFSSSIKQKALGEENSYSELGSHGDCDEMVGSGIVDTLVSYFVGVSVLDNLYERFRRDLTSVLSGFFSQLGVVKTIFWEVIDWIELGLKKTIKDHWFSSLVGFSLVSSFVLFVATVAGVSLFARLVTHAGFNNAMVMSIVSLVAGAFFSILGLSQVIDFEWQQVLTKFMEFFFLKSKENEVVSSDVELIDIATGEMEGSGPVLEFFALDGILALLRKLIPPDVIRRQGPIPAFGSAVRGVSNVGRGLSHFKAFGHHLLSYLANVADTICDFSGGAIRTLNLVLGEDFYEWTKEVHTFAEDTYTSLMMDRMARLAKLRLLEDKRKTIFLYLADPANKIPTIVTTMFGNCSEVLTRALQNASRAKMYDTTRPTPFSICFYGLTGAGKSSALQKITGKLADLLGMPKEGRFYSRKSKTEYWDGYMHQDIVIYDDFGAGPNDDEEWFDLITNTPTPLHQAALADKGMMFTSRIVATTTNVLGMRGDSKLVNREAFFSRRHALIEVRNNPEWYPGSGLEFSQYALRNGCIDGFPYITTTGIQIEEPVWMNQDVLVLFLYESYRKRDQSYLELCGSSPEDPNMTDFKFLLNLPHVFPDLEEDEARLLLELFAGWDDMLGATFRDDPRLHVDGFLISKLKSAFARWHNSLTNVDLMDLFDTQPYHLRGFLLKQAMDNSTEPLRQVYQYSAMNRYLYTRILQMWISRPKKIDWFSSFRSSTKKMYDKMVKSLPPFLKMALAIGFFFIFGWGVYNSIRFLVSAPATLAGLTTAMVGSMLEVSGDTTTAKMQEKSRIRYIRTDFKHGEWWEGGGPSSEPIAEYKSGVSYTDKQLSLAATMDPYLTLLRTSQGVPVRMIALGGQAYLCTWHVWENTVTSGPCWYFRDRVSQQFILNKSNIKTFKISQRDLIVVQLPTALPLAPEGFLKYVIEDETQAPTEVLPILISPTAKDKSNFYFYPHVVSQVVFGGKEEAYKVNDIPYTVWKGYQYVGDFIAGDCGALMLDWNPLKDGVPRALAMHYMNNKSADGVKISRGGAQLLTRKVLSGWEACRGYGMEGSQIDMTSISYLPPLGSLQVLGNASVREAPHYSTQTTLRPSVISDVIAVPNNTEPAILHNDDFRIAESQNPLFDVFTAGMEKYCTMAGPFDECDSDFQDALDDMFDDLDITPSLQRVSEEVALNGIPGIEYFDPIVSSTSEGYPWVLQRPPGEKGKAWLLEGAPGCFSLSPDSPVAIAKSRLESKYKQGVLPPLIGVDCAKDERVSIRKSRINPKTRLFTVLPLEYNILVRELFLPFVQLYMSKHNECMGKVGINVESFEWTLLYSRLREKGVNWFNGDFERFDGCTPRILVQEITKRICKLYIDDHNDLRMMVMLHTSQRYGFAGRKLYHVLSGIPSGFPLTVIINSLINEFYLRFSWKKLVAISFDSYMRSNTFFKSHVEAGVYGDDNIVSVSDQVKDCYNLVTISTFLKKFGIVLKNGQNKDDDNFPPFSPPTSCDFLKRRMIMDRGAGAILAPLDKNSIYGRLHWIRKCDDELAACRENAVTALREACYHGPEFFHELRIKIVAAFQEKGLITNTLPTHNDCYFRWLGAHSGRKEVTWFKEKFPDQIFPSNNSITCIVPGVYTAGVASNPRTKTVVWCGPPRYRRAIVNHRIESKLAGGYASRREYQLEASKLPQTDITFLSADGLSQAVPAIVWFLRENKYPSELVDRFIAAAAKTSGGAPVWLHLVKDSNSDGKW